MRRVSTLCALCLAVSAAEAGAVILHQQLYNSANTAGFVQSWVDGKDLSSGQFAFTDVQLNAGYAVTRFSFWGTAPSQHLQGFRLNIWSHDGSSGRPFSTLNQRGLPNYGWLHQETAYDPLQPAPSLSWREFSDGIYKYDFTLAQPFVTSETGRYWFSIHAGMGSTNPADRWSWALSNSTGGYADWMQRFSPGYPSAQRNWNTMSADLASEVAGDAIPEPSTFALVALGGGLLAGIRRRRSARPDGR